MQCKINSIRALDKVALPDLFCLRYTIGYHNGQNLFTHLIGIIFAILVCIVSAA